MRRGRLHGGGRAEALAWLVSLALLAVGAVLTVSLAFATPAQAAAAPTVSGVSPSTGPLTGGTVLTITGTGFVAGASVEVGGVAATGVTVNSSTQITATTPANAQGPAVITVTNPDTQSATLNGAFTYLGPPPTIGAISPNSGSSLGGTSVTITGTDFVSGATVTFGGVAATSVTFGGATSLTAIAPAHTAGAVDVVVTNPDAQAVTSVGGYTYTAAPAPTVTSVSPSTGTTGGGTAVTITGSGFASGATVTFGGTAATGVSVTSATSLSAVTPAHTAGVVAVVVTNADTQSGTLSNAFTYAATSAPTVSSVSPATGSKDGGTAVTITGSGFLAGASVDFGGTAGTNVVVTSSTQITATTPAHAVGKVIVKVTNTDAKSGSLADGFEFLGPPTLSAVDPTLVATVGGTTINLMGTKFVSGATVTVGGTAATNVTVKSVTEIEAKVPAHAAGVVDIVVTNPDSQKATLTGKLTYAVAPAVSAVVPGFGPAEGGTSVTIAGSGFVSGATVKFGDVAATDVVVVNATQITAKTPAHASGPVSVTVTNSDGLQSTLASGFTYQPAAKPQIVGGEVLDSGISFIVFSGGTSAELTTAILAEGCTETKLRIFATSGGQFVPYIPATQVALVNAPWNALFGDGIPGTYPLIVVCG